MQKSDGPFTRFERFQALEVLRSAAWRSFDARRSYEWKFSIAVWAALLATGGALLAPDKIPNLSIRQHWVGGVAATVVGVFTTLMHWYCTRWCKRRDDQDRKLAYEVLESRMCALLDINYNQEVKAIFEEKPKYNYWHSSHLAITAVLSAILGIAAWMRVLR